MKKSSIPQTAVRRILILVILVEAAIGIVTNVVVDALPGWLQPYRWLAGPLLIVLIMTLIFLRHLETGTLRWDLKRIVYTWALFFLLVMWLVLTTVWWQKERSSQQEIFAERAGLAWSPDSKELAFVSKRDGNEEIYLINIDGSKQTNVTNHPARDRFPSWSPDGKRIAFQSNRDGEDAIYMLFLDRDTGPIRLTSGRDPAWSPDGQRVALEDGATGNFELYIINQDGSSRLNLSVSENSFDASPAWCGDGIQLAFESDREGSQGIYMVEDSGNNLHPVVTSSIFLWAGEPSWSPDCSHLSFQGGTAADHATLHIIDMRESHEKTPRALVPEFIGRDSEWSPNGRYIAFFSSSEGRWHIYVYDIEEEQVLRIPFYSGPKWWLGALITFVTLCVLMISVMMPPTRSLEPTNSRGAR
jgi:Tol biopolymer transport system component